MLVVCNGLSQIKDSSSAITVCHLSGYIDFSKDWKSPEIQLLYCCQCPASFFLVLVLFSYKLGCDSFQTGRQLYSDYSRVFWGTMYSCFICSGHGNVHASSVVVEVWYGRKRPVMGFVHIWT